MKLIDTNGVVLILDNKVKVSDTYYLAPDIKEESEMSELIYGRSLPAELVEISDVEDFDQRLYLNHYNRMLNKHNDRSFFNMTGFGDISLLAVIHALIESFESRDQGRLFASDDLIEVFTKDGPLVKKIEAEFNDKNVVVKPITSLV